MCQHWLQDLDAIQAIVDEENAVASVGVAAAISSTAPAAFSGAANAALLSPVAQEVPETSHTSFPLVSRYRTLFVICILKKWNLQRFEIMNFMGLFFFKCTYKLGHHFDRGPSPPCE